MDSRLEQTLDRIKPSQRVLIVCASRKLCAATMTALVEAGRQANVQVTFDPAAYSKSDPVLTFSIDESQLINMEAIRKFPDSKKIEAKPTPYYRQFDKHARKRFRR